ncbi:unannotated protein [freshwater metagenome]|uniref:Unannotated protein n=1 Tax=freshwater metagenome TaxID=449393 RepID=A0A6J6N8D7_9ZZZZ
MLGPEGDRAAHKVIPFNITIWHSESKYRVSAFVLVGLHLIMREFAALTVIAGGASLSLG